MKILFIGNSYTYFNDMPKMLEKLADENGNNITVHSVTKGGRRLVENLNCDDEYNLKIKALCEQNVYDVLFLQEQSYLPLENYEKFLFGVCELIKLVKPKKTCLYATWGRKEGAPLLSDLNISSEDMTSLLTNAYNSVAKRTGSDVSHVGEAFLNIVKSHPNIELYNPDKSHPSSIGSALAALSHYYKLFKVLPTAYSSLEVSEEIFKTFCDTIIKTEK